MARNTTRQQSWSFHSASTKYHFPRYVMSNSMSTSTNTRNSWSQMILEKEYDKSGRSCDSKRIYNWMCRQPTLVCTWEEQPSCGCVGISRCAQTQCVMNVFHRFRQLNREMLLLVVSRRPSWRNPPGKGKRIFEIKIRFAIKCALHQVLDNIKARLPLQPYRIVTKRSVFHCLVSTQTELIICN